MDMERIWLDALIEISINDFGTADQKATWEHWVSSRQDLNDLYDAPLVVRHVVLETTKSRIDFLSRQLQAPWLILDGGVYLKTTIERLREVAEKLLGTS